MQSLIRAYQVSDWEGPGFEAGLASGIWPGADGKGTGSAPESSSPGIPSLSPLLGGSHSSGYSLSVTVYVINHPLVFFVHTGILFVGGLS